MPNRNDSRILRNSAEQVAHQLEDIPRVLRELSVVVIRAVAVIKTLNGDMELYDGKPDVE